tara:strand:- start:332 stop:664 length:333 start_codon:yes stop_codon:yes gene_type:complete
MRAVTSHGAPKITMNSQESDYQEKLKAARAQGDGNPNIFGAQIQTPRTEPDRPETGRDYENAFDADREQAQAEEPNQVGTDRLEKRLELYAKAGSNAGLGNNDRSDTMSI